MDFLVLIVDSQKIWSSRKVKSTKSTIFLDKICKNTKLPDEELFFGSLKLTGESDVQVPRPLEILLGRPPFVEISICRRCAAFQNVGLSLDGG
jgi:hypothetical protein